MSQDYRVATISRLLAIISVFCRISSFLLGSFAKETYNFKEPTNRSHPKSIWRWRLCAITSWYMWQNSCTCVTWLMCMFDMTYAFMWLTHSCLRHGREAAEAYRNRKEREERQVRLQHTATGCNTLQHAATQCNTLQHTVIHCNTLQHTAAHCSAQ